MRTSLDSGELVPRAQAWRVAALLPLLLVIPWVQMCRGLAAPAPVGTLRGLLLVVLLMAVTVTDLLRRRIYNWTTYTVLGWVVLMELAATLLNGYFQDSEGCLVRLVSCLGALPWQESLAGFAAGFGIMFVLYNLFQGGAGDLKLVAVLGALVGANQIVEILIYSYILAGILAACLLVAAAGPGGILGLVLRSLGVRGRFAETPREVSQCLKRRLPMAPFISGGAALALILS